MNYFILSIAVAFCFVVYGQEPQIEMPSAPPPPPEITRAAKFTVPDSVNNSSNSRYVTIPGTKISLIAPYGYALTSRPAGIMRGDYGITVSEKPGLSFRKASRNFNRKKFESEGGKVNELKTLTVNGYEAIFADLQTSTRNFILVFGDNTFSATVTGIAPLNDRTAQDEIERHLFSVCYNKNLIADVSDPQKFDIDLSSTNLKLNKSTGDVFIYTTEGRESTDPNTVSLVVVQMAYTPDANTTPEVMAENYLNSAKSEGFIVETVNRGELKIDGQVAFFVDANVEIHKEKWRTHLVVTENKTHLFQIQATSHNPEDPNFTKLTGLIEAMKIR